MDPFHSQYRVVRWDVGHEVAPVAAVDGRRRPLLLERGLHQLRLQLGDRRLQLAHLLLQAEHQLGAGQVDAVLRRQRRDLAERRQVGVGVAAGAAGRAAAAAPGRAPRRRAASGGACRPAPRRPRSCSGGGCRSCAASGEQLVARVAVAGALQLVELLQRLPLLLGDLGRHGDPHAGRAGRRCPSPFSCGAPRPFTRSSLPSVEPAGTLTFTRSPSGVGISMLAPIAASEKVTGTSTTRSSPRHLKIGLSVDLA